MKEKEEKKELIESIDCTPTWISLLPIFNDFIDNGNSEQKQLLKDELKKLCNIADQYNKITK